MAAAVSQSSQYQIILPVSTPFFLEVVPSFRKSMLMHPFWNIKVLVELFSIKALQKSSHSPMEEKHMLFLLVSKPLEMNFQIAQVWLASQFPTPSQALEIVRLVGAPTSPTSQYLTALQKLDHGHFADAVVL